MIRGRGIRDTAQVSQPLLAGIVGGLLVEVAAYESLDHVRSKMFLKDNKTLIPWLKSKLQKLGWKTVITAV